MNSQTLKNDQLTICSVSYSSASLLKLNLTLTREINSAPAFHWLIVDNNNDFQHHEPDGVQKTDRFIQGDPCVNQGELRGSYHHAQALNKAVKLVTTRYLMVIDPDFFIFQRNWIEELLEYMSKNGLSFFGAPYYPDLTWKRRYFPTVSCMIIDLAKVSKSKLDFTPELDEYHVLFNYPTGKLMAILMGKIPNEVAHVDHSVLSEIIWVILRNRWIAEPLSNRFPKRFYPNVNVSRDTGFKIQNVYGTGRSNDKIEMLKPSYVNDLFTKKDVFFMNLFAWMYYMLVPENFSIYPKQCGYSTPARFKDFGLYDVRGQLGWEEYFWNNKPFAMHLKGGTRKFEDIGYDKLQEILFQLAGKTL